METNTIIPKTMTFFVYSMEDSLIQIKLNNHPYKECQALDQYMDDNKMHHVNIGNSIITRKANLAKLKENWNIEY